VAAGDLNATPLSGAHALVTAELTDAWELAGWGLGHTFPGAASPGSSRPRVLGVYVPQWLVRIDYLFVSRDVTVLSAAIGPWDGVSDHRPVVADITWRP
jgi:endonuclease/exonuclease/phosphatase (EEP) superfamily protein YafD